MMLDVIISSLKQISLIVISVLDRFIRPISAVSNVIETIDNVLMFGCFVWMMLDVIISSLKQISLIVISVLGRFIRPISAVSNVIETIDNVLMFVDSLYG